MFHTLDGIEYSYDICNHILLRHRSGGLFSITGDFTIDVVFHCAQRVALFSPSQLPGNGLLFALSASPSRRPRRHSAAQHGSRIQQLHLLHPAGCPLESIRSKMSMNSTICLHVAQAEEMTSSITDFQIRGLGNAIVFLSNQFGFRITWDVYSNVNIQVNRS